jgi:hypothetical protein
MSLTDQDKESLLNMFKSAFNGIPGIMKDLIKPSMVLDYIKSVPAAFRKYTLQELIDALEEARHNGKLV